jgi:hypothetical protein
MCGCREQSIHLPTSTVRLRLFPLSSKTVSNPVIAQAISSIPFAVQPCSNHLYHRFINRCGCRPHTNSIAPQVLPKSHCIYQHRPPFGTANSAIAIRPKSGVKHRCIAITIRTTEISTFKLTAAQQFSFS